MKRKNRSILRDLEHILEGDNRHKNLESRASHIIMSASNLLESLRDEHSDEEINELRQKMFSGIKNKNPERFSNALKKIRKNRDTKNE